MSLTKHRKCVQPETTRPYTSRIPGWAKRIKRLKRLKKMTRDGKRRNVRAATLQSEEGDVFTIRV